MTPLEKARMEIDSIDRQIASLYEKRLEQVEHVLDYKLKNHMQVLDSSRENEILSRNAGYIQNPDYVDKYLNLQKFIMSESRKYQESLMATEIVAYQGIEGAFSHMVSEKLFPNNPKLAYSNFEDVFKAVCERKAEFGIIPFENTNSGLVGEVLDLLMEYPVFIHDVWDQKIEQCLLGIKGATMKDVEWVYSKDQALLQAREFIKGLGAEPVPYPNTALAAQYVAMQQDKTKAAIGAKENAALYGLDILAPNIETDTTNTTRFLVISLKENEKGSHFSCCLTFQNIVGGLARVIEIIARHGINMDSIQSRPLKGHPFEYFFYIEMDDVHYENLRACLEELKENTGILKLFGRYDLHKEEKVIIE